jgi:endonuclease/exonuclease/phosphatase family metal-dependent hydrolase
MNYGMTDLSYCPSAINSIDDKNDYIRTIIGHTLPDIVGFVEVFRNNTTSTNSATAYQLLGALNSDGRNYYKFTEFNTPSSLSGIVYYNKNKFVVSEEINIEVSVLRNLRIYRLVDTVGQKNITVSIVLGHLDTGQDGDYGRAQQIAALYDKIENYGNNDNYMIMGDLNVYSDDELMFNDILRHPNAELRFEDPIDEMGVWHDDNTQFKNYHTQSTSAYNNPSYNDCFASGGLDDRFDMILVDDDIMSGEGNILYLEDSYKTLGQDGNHTNTYLTNGENTSAPENVIDALQKNSDHLPVYADFIFGEPAGIAFLTRNQLRITCQNPATSNLNLSIKSATPEKVEICIYNLLGTPLFKNEYFVNGKEELSLPILAFAKGLYILTAKTQKGISSLRFIKE